MSFDDNRVRIGTIPGPVNLVGGDSVEVSCLAQETALLNKKPDLAVEHVVDLFRLVRMRRGVVPRRPCGVHQAAFVAITASYNHRAFAFHSGSNYFALRHIFGFHVQRHDESPAQTIGSNSALSSFGVTLLLGVFCTALWAQSPPPCRRGPGI